MGITDTLSVIETQIIFVLLTIDSKLRLTKTIDRSTVKLTETVDKVIKLTRDISGKLRL